jgi:hypothetical protein
MTRRKSKMSKTSKHYGDQPGNQQVSREVPGFDRQRRMLLGGVAGAIATALFTTACKSSEEEVETATATAEAEPAPTPAATAAPAAPDPLIPPGADPLSAEEMAWAEQFLSRNVSVDAHCHPGIHQLPSNAVSAGCSEEPGHE